MAYAKANPGKLNFTVAGTQNISHLAPVLLFARAGVELVMVPAKSEPQAVSDLIAGQVDLYFGNSSALLPHINSDKIRLIAVGTAQRLAGRAGHSGGRRDAAGLRVLVVERLLSRRRERPSRSSRRSGRDHGLRQVARDFRASDQARASCRAG